MKNFAALPYVGSPSMRGVTLIQLMIAVAIVGVIASIAVPSYRTYVERSRVARAIGDLGRIEVAIKRFEIANGGVLPETLADVGFDAAPDPWGSGYRYVNLSEGGKPRTDHAAAAVNSDFDLYSLGGDRASAENLLAPESRDDIVRGSDGAYLGLVSDYTRLPR